MKLRYFIKAFGVTIFFSSNLLITKTIAGQKMHMSAEYNYTREAELASQLDLDNPDPDQMRSIFSRRRARVLQAIPDGALLVFSAERTQPRRLEFQVPHSDNHDFTFLTGVDGLDSYDSAILLVPTQELDWVVLYTSADIEVMRSVTGIKNVRPFPELEEDLSVALTDYRDWRITQIRRWPLPAALSKIWGRNNKVLFLNYPRFLRLGMPEPPRIAYFEKLKRFSPELDIRDSGDILDPIRMLHDAYGLASLRRAVTISGEGIVEGLRAVRPGLTEKHIMEIIDFVYRYRGGILGFPTAVRKMPMDGPMHRRSVPEGFIQFVPRSGGRVFEESDMVHVDTGAAFNHHSADLQRNVPVDGKFSPKQRLLYQIALDVQKTVISMIQPGVTWWELHERAVSMLREAGGYDQYYTYGIGHFIGMEVHDEGDYEAPLMAGMVLSIEQGVAPPDGPRVAFEDDVIVTEVGHEWLSQSIPIEIDDVEAMAASPTSFRLFLDK